MLFLEFPAPDGDSFVVNVDHIVSVTRHDDFTVIAVSDDYHHSTTMPYADVLNKLAVARYEAQPDIADARAFVIWSHEHTQWWGPNHRGYVSTLREAGRYTVAEVGAIVTNAYPPGIEVAVEASLAATAGVQAIYGQRGVEDDDGDEQPVPSAILEAAQFFYDHEDGAVDSPPWARDCGRLFEGLRKLYPTQIPPK